MQNTFAFVNAEASALFWTLFGIYWISEMIVGSRLRAGAQDKPDDRRTLPLLFVVMFTSWILARVCIIAIPQAAFGNEATYVVGIVFMIIGQFLRWWSIATLGRFFTVNVAIRIEHRVIDSGPYRFVRHPSYTAMLLVYLGMGLCMGNALSLAVIMIPSTVALLHRIRVEEDVLQIGLGDAYRNYMRRTKRLIPGIY